MARKVSSKKSPAQALALPVLKKGEIYKGILVDQAGKPTAHVAELTIAVTSKNYADAMAFAKKQGYQLPDRREGALLRASDPFGLTGWFWLREPYEPNDAYAWCQYFDDGYQLYGRKDDDCRVRLVRVIPI